MLIEQSAYANRWRQVSPAAKGLFSLCGMIAAFAAATPRAACVIAALLCAVTLFGAGIPAGRYLRAAAPALFFLAISTLSLAVSLKLGAAGGDISLQPAHSEWQHIARVCGRSLVGLAALLFLALTTPLSNLIALLHRLKVPAVLLDIMTLCYRTLFVFSAAIHDTLTAQTARLGYATMGHSRRSLGSLVANLTIQVWQRSHALHLAALARNNDGPLRFLEETYPASARDILIAAGSGSALILLVLGLP